MKVYKVKLAMRNLVYLLCWLPWDNGDKLSSSNNSKETVIYLNFWVINRSAVHSSMGDGIHLTYHHESELAAQALLVVSREEWAFLGLSDLC